MEGITLDDKVRLTFSYLEVECNLRTQHNDVRESGANADAGINGHAILKCFN